MATKGKTRGPEEHKHIRQTQKQDAKYETREKREQKDVWSKKK